VYLPTLDYAFQQLLLPLVNATTCSNATPSSSFPTDMVKEIKWAKDLTVCILHLVRRIQASDKANPKTCYQVLTSKANLVGLSKALSIIERDAAEKRAESKRLDCEVVIADILKEGLFEAEYHLAPVNFILTKMPLKGDQNGLDLTSVASTKSYQGILFTLFDSNLNVRKNKDLDKLKTVADTATFTDALYLMHISPVILHCFCAVTEIVTASRKSSSKDTSNDNAPFKIFAFFAYLAHLWIVNDDLSLSMEQQNTGWSKKMAASTIHKLLELLLQHNVYVPANDTSNSQFSYLSFLTNRTILSQSDGIAADRGAVSDMLCTCQCLFLLNHRLLHSHLTSIFKYTSSLNDYRDYETQIVRLYVSMLDTYTKLRQQHHVVVQLLKVWETSSESSLQFYEYILRQPDVNRSLMLFVQQCPSSQRTQLLQELKSTSLDALKTARDGNENDEKLRVVVTLATIAVRNSRVDAGSASELALFCRDFCHAVGATLAKSSSASTLLQHQCLVMMNSLVDTHTRCVFWTSEHGLLDVSAVLLSLIDESQSHSDPFHIGGSSPVNHQISCQLTFLCCHRIRQLHGLLHEYGFKSINSPVSSEQRATFLNQAKALAKFAGQTSMRSGESWCAVACHFAIWAPYAETDAIRQFYCNLLDSLSPCTECVADTERYETARLLMTDATFRDYIGRDPLFASTLIQYIAHHLDSLCRQRSQTIDPKRPIDKLVQLSVISELEQSVASFIASMNSDAKHGENTADILLLVAVEKIQTSTKLLESLGSLHLPPDTQTAAMKICMLCDRLCGSIIGLAVDAQTFGRAMDWYCTVRSTLLSILSTDKADARLDDTYCDIATKYLDHLLSDHNKYSNIFSVDKIRDEHTQDYISRYTVLTGQLVSTIILVLTRPGHEQPVKNALQAIFSHLNNAKPSYVSEELLPVIAASTLSVVWRQFSAFAIELASFACNQVWKYLAANESSGTSHAHVLLFGEWLRLSQHCQILQSFDLITVNRLYDKIINSAINAQDNASLQDSAVYAIACTAETPLYTAHGTSIADALLQIHKPTPLCHALFCDIVQKLEIQNIVALSDDLMDKEKTQVSALVRLQYLRLLMQNVSMEDRDVWEKTGHDIFMFALEYGSVRKDDPQSGDTCVAALDLVNELVRNAKYIQLSPFDISQIFAHISCALGPGGNAHSIADAVYAACSSLFLQLLQRYSKIMYTCVPSVMSTLCSLLRNGIYGSISESSVKMRGNQFTKICEQLLDHRDIYKKYVSVLLLEFVHCLGLDMQMHVKEAFVTAVYLLLDCLTPHETKQLNDLMPIQSRVLFRSIHASYTKLHTFKGQ
jgi:Urb2/Npa2 family